MVANSISHVEAVVETKAFVGRSIYRGIRNQNVCWKTYLQGNQIIPGFLWCCEMDFTTIHSMGLVFFDPPDEP